MSRTAGQRQRPKDVTQVLRKRGRRPTVSEVPPLCSTYDAVKAPGAWFDEKRAGGRVVRRRRCRLVRPGAAGAAGLWGNRQPQASPPSTAAGVFGPAR